MQENFLHFVWRTGRFDQQHLRTTAGHSISLFRRGIYDGHAGPDFTNAHLRIGDTVWHGHVEMHVFASEWYQHKHDRDPLYDGTVLHVVWEEDQPVFRQDGTRLPCLELRPLVHPSLLGQYQRLIQDGNGIPCKFRLSDIPDLVKSSMLDRVLIERLDRKANRIQEVLEQQGGDWEQTTFITLAHGLGNPVNAEPMEQLARQLPLPLLQRYRQQPLQVDAMILGTAGLLHPGLTETYPQQLIREFEYILHKHPLKPMATSRWKYLRMRPVGFPDLRLARLSSLITHHENWLANILYSTSPKEWMNSLEVGIHPYWTHHYRLGKVTSASPKLLGKDIARSLVINVMIPILYTYGRMRGESIWQEKALHFLSTIQPESNTITRTWSRLGLPSKHAADSQALLELKSNYCAQRRCLQCALGCFLLKKVKLATPDQNKQMIPN